MLSVWCEVCGLDLDMYTGLAELARSADGPVPTWFETWLEAERAAHMLRYWSPLIVTTLFQTADYRCAVVMAGGIDAERAEELTAATMERQNVLSRPDPPEVIAVLHELVLHPRMRGCPGTSRLPAVTGLLMSCIPTPYRRGTRQRRDPWCAVRR